MAEFHLISLFRGQLWFVDQILLLCHCILHIYKLLVKLIYYSWWSKYRNFKFFAALPLFYHGPLFHNSLWPSLRIHAVFQKNKWMFIFQFQWRFLPVIFLPTQKGHFHWWMDSALWTFYSALCYFISVMYFFS